MKERRSISPLAALIILVIGAVVAFAVGYALNQAKYNNSRVTYQLDTVNDCSDGIHTGVYGRTIEISVLKNDESALLQTAKTHGLCIN